jgi:adenosylhomocysteine nucleosidase
VVRQGFDHSPLTDSPLTKMNDIAITDPCVLFALKREARVFLQEFRPQQRFPGAPCRARFCGPEWLTVLVLETGIGQKRTEEALRWLLAKPVLVNVPYQPKVVISCGFAGALQPELQVGDLVLATEVIDVDGHTWPVPWPGHLPPGDWQPPMKRSRLLTTPQMITEPAQKRELGIRHQALAVDMESAVAASICSRQEVSFACLRVISDRVDTALSPQLVSVLSGAGVSWMGLASLLARQPHKLGELWRLFRATSVASRQLAKALGELLTLTLPWEVNQE